MVQKQISPAIQGIMSRRESAIPITSRMTPGSRGPITPKALESHFNSMNEIEDQFEFVVGNCLTGRMSFRLTR